MSHQMMLIIALVFLALGVLAVFTSPARRPDDVALACFVAANVWAAAYVIS